MAFIGKSKSDMPPENIAYYMENFNRAKVVDNDNRRRGIRNMEAMSGVRFGQFTPDQRAYLDRDGRDPDTYNFLQAHVKGIAGNFITNWFDPKFTQSGESSVSLDTLELLSNLWFSNKDIGDYKGSSLNTIIDGCTYRGVETMRIVKPVRNDPRTWYIGFFNIRPDMVIFDPDNITNDISRNSKQCWMVPYMSVKDMLAVYPEKRDMIIRAFGKSYKKDTPLYAESRMDIVRDLDNPLLGSRHQVVQHNHIENETVRQHLHIPTGVILPETEFSFNSEQDINAKRDMALQNGLLLTDDDVTEVTDILPTSYITTFVPSMGLELEHGKDEIQLGGHLPFYAWSYLEYKGFSIGIVDLLWECQRDLNRREMAKTKWLSKTLNAKPYLHPMLFNNDEKKMNAAIADFSDPSKPIIASAESPEGITNSLIGVIQGGQIPPGIFQDESFKIEMMNRISGLTPAMQGFSERSGESGIHFGRKVVEGSINQKVVQEKLIKHEHDKASDWVKMVPKIYGGRHNYNRKFSTRDNQQAAVANEITGRGDTGEPIIKNDLAKLGRVDVIVNQSKENDYLKQFKRETDIAMLTALQPKDGNTELISVLENHLVLNTDFTDEAEKSFAEGAARKNSEFQSLSMELRIAQTKQAIMQIQQQQQQMAQGIPPAAAPEGGPAPQQGEMQTAQAPVPSQEAPAGV